MFLNTCLPLLRLHELGCWSLTIMERYFWKLKGALGWFSVLVLEKLKQVNGEAFAGCPC